MPSTKNNKDARSKPATESKPGSSARSVLDNFKVLFSKPSKSKANAKRLLEGKDTQGPVDPDSPSRSPSVVNQTRQPKPADEENTDSKSSACARKGVAFLRVIGELVGVSTEFAEEEMSKNESVGEYCGILAKWIKDLTESKIPQAMRGGLENLHSELSRIATEDDGNVEDARWRVTNCLQMFVMEILITGRILPNKFDEIEKQLSGIQDRAREDALHQALRDLPCAAAAFNDYTAEYSNSTAVNSDYTPKNQSRTSCFEGTRVALLKELLKWLSESESNIYVLFGLAGIGKSTIAQTISEKADQTRLLGASFFFSRYDPDRREVKKFFTTISYQLCVHDPEFAAAIESVMLSGRGKGAAMKRPLEQLKTLILEPLQKLAPRRVVVIVDALDECDDAPTILEGLNRLVRGLPSFKVFLTTRPQKHPLLKTGPETSKKVFHVHNMEDKIVVGDIELYLRHKLSWTEVEACLPNLRDPWAASDEDIRSLAHGAGGLFIIASTAVLFVLDRNSTPASRMKTLRKELDQGHMRSSLSKLNDFYTVILRNAVPKGCEPDTAELYQAVIGAIVLLQQPLPVPALAALVNVEMNGIFTVLGNLQAVILLGSNNIPVVYHKSFPDYIQDPKRCKDEDLRIDTRFHHTRMAIQCLQLLNRRLKQNIMDLGDPARFMNNDEALEKQGLTVKEKILPESQYACSYFANHIQSADEDANLAEELEIFVNERLLNWLEGLSWIGKLDSAHLTLLMVQKQLPTESDLGQLVADGLRFVGKFYDIIRESALHIYHSALPFTPTETSLYKKYRKQLTFCRVQGGEKTWDAAITNVSYAPLGSVDRVVFSRDSSLFACLSNWREVSGGIERARDGFMGIHDAIAGIPLGRIEGRVFAIGNDFSKAAAFDEDTITLYNINGGTPVATIKPSATVVELALSPDGSRLVAGLDDGTIGLWDTEKCGQIKTFDRPKKSSSVVFSSDGGRIAFASCDDVVKLLDGVSGETVAELYVPGLQWSTLMFSGDDSRLACLAVRRPEEFWILEFESTLKIWNSRDGALIVTGNDVGETMAISTNGSLVATGSPRTLRLWSGIDLALLETLDLDIEISSLVIHNHLLGMLSSWGDSIVALYDINSHALIARLSFNGPNSLAFSPDCSRIAAGNDSGEVRLWDVPSIITSNIIPQEELSKPTRLAFSPDYSRLVSGHEDGSIKLWDTSNIVQLATHKSGSGWPRWIKELAFSVDGGKFASRSGDRIIYLWNGKDGAPDRVLKFADRLGAMALSSSILATATYTSITLWDLKTDSPIAELDQRSSVVLAFSHHHSLLAVAHFSSTPEHDHQYTLSLWDIEKHACVTTSYLDHEASKIQFLPDDSQLGIQDLKQRFRLFNPYDGGKSIENEAQAISRLGLCPSWQGIPVWAEWTGNGDRIVGQFPQQEKELSVLNCTSDLRFQRTAVGSSMIALACEDGRILLLKGADYV